ncbi:hypothetical protein SEPCBS57363_002848 [Sporothrix epigloea]|uniref:Uncharacterized protein n=1 Tax=Sporothrix epigloea TaxID=1892477 RepID=A0ABP0DKW9_9PEZI
MSPLDDSPTDTTTSSSVSKMTAPTIDVHFEFEHRALEVSAPSIELAFEFEQLEAILNEEFFRTIEHNAFVQAKMTIQNLAMHDKLNRAEMTYIKYMEGESEETDITDPDTAFSLHSAAFDEVDESFWDEESSAFIESPEDGKEVDAGAVEDGIAVAIIEDFESNEAPNGLVNDFQIAADTLNEDMSMIEFDYNDIYLLGAATEQESPVPHLPTISECVEKSKDLNQESDDDDRITSYSRDNLISAYKMFANTIESDPDQEEEESASKSIAREKASDLDPLGREPPSEDHEAKEKFKLKLFTIHEETENEKGFATHNTFAPVDEMARLGLLFSDEECEDDIMASFDISIESFQVDEYESGTAELTEPAKPVDFPSLCADLSKRTIKAPKKSSNASRHAGFQFEFSFPVPTDTTTDREKHQLSTDLITSSAIVSPAFKSDQVADIELDGELADGATDSKIIPLVVDTQYGNDLHADKRVKYHEDAWNSLVEAPECFPSASLSDERLKIVDWGFVGPVPACYHLPTVNDRVIEEVIEAEVEPLYTNVVLETCSSAAFDLAISSSATTPELPQHPIISTDPAEDISILAENEVAKLDAALCSTLDIECGDDSFDAESIGAAIDALLLVLPTAETDAESIDRDAITAAIDQVLLLLPLAECRSDIEKLEAVIAEIDPLTEKSLEKHRETASLSNAPEPDEYQSDILPATEQHSIAHTEPLEDFLSPELTAMNHEESMLEAWETYSQRSEDSLDTSEEAWRIYDRVIGRRLNQCTWALLEQPNVFGSCSGPLLMLTTPEGDTRYPQDMKVYGGQSDWADLDEDDEL